MYMNLLADKIKERLKLGVHVPAWKEKLILKPREMESEIPPAEEPSKDVLQPILNNIIDLEKELSSLKKRVKENAADLSEDDIDRFKYILEELQELYRD